VLALRVLLARFGEFLFEFGYALVEQCVFSLQWFGGVQGFSSEVSSSYVLVPCVLYYMIGRWFKGGG
jgi:hypothetical protein